MYTVLRKNGKGRRIQNKVALKYMRTQAYKAYSVIVQQQRLIVLLNTLTDVYKDKLDGKTKRISELQSTIDSLKRQNRELQAELIAKDGIIKKQTIMMEEAKPKEAKYIKAGNQYYCSNCEADFQHYELFNKYCPECGASFTNSRKETL